eukprot:COSAG01_NODE_55981_length_321_cov_1.162162_1_plen_50_part_10
MPRLAKKLGIAPFDTVPDAALIPIEYGALAYYVDRQGGSATNKFLTMFAV